MSENNNDKKKKLNFTTDFIHKTAAQLYEIKKMHYSEYKYFTIKWDRFFLDCNDQDNYDFDEEDLSVASKVLCFIISIILFYFFVV